MFNGVNGLTIHQTGGLNNATAGTPSASGTVSVTDVDSGQAGFKIPNNLSGTYGDFTFNEATGAWTYDLDNTRAATQALRDGETVYDRLTVTSTDDTQITFTVMGTANNGVDYTHIDNVLTIPAGQLTATVFINSN